MISIRPIKTNEWRKYRNLRLRALRDSPDAFGSTYEVEEARTDSMWVSWIDAATSSGKDSILLRVDWELVALCLMRLSHGHARWIRVVFA